MSCLLLSVYVWAGERCIRTEYPYVPTGPMLCKFSENMTELLTQKWLALSVINSAYLYD